MWQSPPLINTSRVLNKIIAFYVQVPHSTISLRKVEISIWKNGAEWNGGGDDSICFGEFLQQSRMELGKVTEIILLAKHTCQIFLGFSSGDKSGIFGNWCKEKLESFEAKSNPTILQFLGIICSFGVYKISQSRLSTSLSLAEWKSWCWSKWSPPDQIVSVKKVPKSSVFHWKNFQNWQFCTFCEDYDPIFFSK